MISLFSKIPQFPESAKLPVEMRFHGLNVRFKVDSLMQLSSSAYHSRSFANPEIYNTYMREHPLLNLSLHILFQKNSKPESTSRKEKELKNVKMKNHKTWLHLPSPGHQKQMRLPRDQRKISWITTSKLFG